MNAHVGRGWLHAVRIAGLIMIMSMVVLAHPSFAQDGNPFADSGAQSTAISVVKSLVFWSWIACGIGALVWVGAYWFQGIIPDVYNQMRGMLRNGILIMLLLNIIVSFILSQAEAAQGAQALPTMQMALAAVGLA